MTTSAHCPDMHGAGCQAVLRRWAEFLLGYGWNLCFIGGSAHLARDLPVLERTRVEGAVDIGICAAAALAGVAPTAPQAAAGYPASTGDAGMLVILPALVLIRRRSRQPGLTSERT